MYPSPAIKEFALNNTKSNPGSEKKDGTGSLIATVAICLVALAALALAISLLVNAGKNDRRDVGSPVVSGTSLSDISGADVYGPQVITLDPEAQTTTTTAPKTDVAAIVADVAANCPTDYNYSNDMFKLCYDKDSASISDQYEESSAVLISGGNNTVTGVSFQYRGGLFDCDTVAELADYVNGLKDFVEVRDIQSSHRTEDDVDIAECTYKMIIGEYEYLSYAKLMIKGGDSIMVNMNSDDTVSEDTLRSIASAYYSVRFS